MNKPNTAAMTAAAIALTKAEAAHKAAQVAGARAVDCERKARYAEQAAQRAFEKATEDFRTSLRK